MEQSDIKSKNIEEVNEESKEITELKKTTEDRTNDEKKATEELEEQNSFVEENGKEKYETDDKKFVFDNINEELLDELISFDVPKIRALKALHFTQNKSTESALDWLEQHEDEDDIDVMPKLENEPSVSKLTKEEALGKAYELQRKLREKRLEKEKIDEVEREKNRIKSMKMMKEQQEKLQEEERKRNYFFLKKEKLERAKEKEYQKQLLKKEWEERFGKPYPEEELEEELNIKTKSSKDQIIFYCSKLRKKYKNTNKEDLKTCLSTLKAYFKNANENPTNQKYHSIKKENKVFKSRVQPLDGAVDLLIVAGFKDAGDSYSISGYPDGYLLGTSLKYIEIMLSQL